MESLMGLFFLLTLYCVIRGHDSPHRLWWHTGAVACCALGMGSKEVMAVAPVIALLYDRIFLARSWLELGRERWGLYTGLAAAWLILILLVISRNRRGGSAEVAVVSGGGYAQKQIGGVTPYIRFARLPRRLC